MRIGAARRSRIVELERTAKASKRRRTVAFRQPLSIVDTTPRTLARVRRINDVPVLTSIRRLRVVARRPRILRPEHFGATVGTLLRPNQCVFHVSLHLGRRRQRGSNTTDRRVRCILYSTLNLISVAGNAFLPARLQRSTVIERWKQLRRLIH